MEDEAPIREGLEDLFGQSGFEVETSADGEDALARLTLGTFDLVLLDLMIPGLTGLEVLRRLRAAGDETPVLVLTAKGEEDDVVAGIEAGADDYVTKPFYLEELEARVNALLRRVSGRTTERADYGPVTIDFSARTVNLNNVALELTAYEYNTLAYLAHRAGTVVSKTELTEHLYQQDHDRDSNVIEVFVGRLRRKLDPGGQLQPIETVRGAGYRFALVPVAR